MNTLQIGLIQGNLRCFGTNCNMSRNTRLLCYFFLLKYSSVLYFTLFPSLGGRQSQKTPCIWSKDVLLYVQKKDICEFESWSLLFVMVILQNCDIFAKVRLLCLALVTTCPYIWPGSDCQIAQWNSETKVDWRTIGSNLNFKVNLRIGAERKAQPDILIGLL